MISVPDWAFGRTPGTCRLGGYSLYEPVSIAGREQGGRPTGITVTFNHEAYRTPPALKALITAIYSTRARGIL
jgi:hypothetical protein